jgi:aspartyl-tRNA(Asn)/glutamyl-tRNA(Gln) amidotransferase subunit C
MSLTRHEIEHVAHLSRLKFAEEEIERYTAQLNSILGHFEALTEADTSQASGTTHVVPMVNVLREDVRRPNFTPDEALANAPERLDNLFKVPRVVE